MMGKFQTSLTAMIAVVVSSVTFAASLTPEQIREQLDVQSEKRSVAYAPRPDEPSHVNPPAFIWLPVEGEATYALQISSSPEFPEDQTRQFTGLRHTAFVPQQTLEPGQWYWRYGVETASGTLFGKARPFTVASNATAFPYPDWDRIIPDISHQRPRLFFDEARLQDLRQAAQGELREEVDALIARCEEHLGEELIPEPPVIQSNEDAAKGIATTRPPMDIMEDCALAYLLTDDERFAQEARRRLVHFFRWDPEGSTSLFVFDEPAMWMMMRGVRTYDWVYDFFTPEERQLVERNMKARARQFVKLLEGMPFEAYPFQSHPGRLPGFLGEAALCFIHEWPEAREWLDYSTLIYYTAYPAWGGPDGGWQEGPNYWGGYMNFALHYVVALRKATGVDLMRKPFFRNTPWYILYTATPYISIRPFGDGETWAGPPIATAMQAFAGLLEDPYLLWYIQDPKVKLPKKASVLALATRQDNLQPKAPTDLPDVRLFPSVGLAALHTDLGNKENDITFLFRSSPYGGQSHGHAAQNAFFIDAFGQGLAIVTGYYPWYFSDHHRFWTRATKSKNSILVNGEGQLPRSWDAGQIIAFHHDASYDYLEGEAGPAYGDKLTRFRRKVLHIRPGTYVMCDDLRAPEPSTYQWLLHTFEEMQIDPDTQRIHVTRSPSAMDVHLLFPKGLKLVQTDGYDPEPEAGDWVNTWHLTASTIKPKKQTRFLSVHLPYREGNEAAQPEVELVTSRNAIGAKLTMADGHTHLVAWRIDDEADQIQCGGFLSDGSMFSVELDPQGRVVNHLVHDGRMIRRQ